MNDIELWDKFRENKLSAFLNSHEELIFFFKQGKEYFAATEDGRMIFAKLKNPDEDTPKQWLEEASFLAFNLGKDGAVSQRIFYKKDISGLKVVDKEEVEEKLC